MILKIGLIWLVAAGAVVTVDGQCESDEIQCDGSECINADYICDGVIDCDDGSDEQLRNVYEDYDANSTFCRGDYGFICVMPQPNATGLCQEDWQCKSHEFQCADGSRCIDSDLFCNGYEDCLNGSDEIARSRTEYKPNKIYYQGDLDRICVIPDTYSEFKEEKCAIKNDSCTCKHHGKNIFGSDCFRCLSNPHYVLQVSQICDGIVDCPDLSDECLCPSKSRLGICQSIVVTKNQRPNLFVTCGSLNETWPTPIVNETMICDMRDDCPDGADEKGCTNNISLPNSTQETIPDSIECKREEEIKACTEMSLNCKDCLCEPNEKEYCTYLRLKSTDVLKMFQRCYDHSASHGKRMCNGKKDCDDEIDEKYCEATRFYCKNDELLPNIPLRKRCDLIEDCVNGTDELNCPAHFYCNDKGKVKYIPQSSKADGVEDCESGIDECISVDSVFSDQTSMISNKIVLAVVWIISVSAIVGCLAVIATTVRDLTQPRRSGQLAPFDHTEFLRILILSLSISDFLVAVYTFTICVKALEFNHDYCQTDRIWRGSSSCSALGVILVIGSEQTVFTMVLIAVLRTYFVWRPFAQPNIRAAIFAVLTTWIISIIVATVPLATNLEDYFVKNTQFKGNGLLKVVSTHEVQYTIDWLSLIPEAKVVGTTEWSKLRNLALTVNPSTTFIEFGYYSTHTVCLPTLFPDTSEEPAWGFTMFLIIVNFLAFLTILMLYLVLYRLASGKKVFQKSVAARKKQQDANSKMQRKLTRIVASDFFCWMPICIMGFLQISGVPIPRDAYLPAGLLIIPINSALNPLLYSDIPEFVLQKLKEVKNKFDNPVSNVSSGEIEMEVTAQQTEVA